MPARRAKGESAVKRSFPIGLLVLAGSLTTALIGNGGNSDAAEIAARSRHGTTAASAPVAFVRPTPPRQYWIRRPVVVVRTSTQLRAALTRRTPARIVLRPGRYDAAGPFVNENGHAIYSQAVGQAVLTAGVSMGHPGGVAGLLQGVVIDVRDAAKTVDGVAVMVQGNAGGVFDVVLRGHRTIRSGLVVRQPEGFRTARLVVRDFTDYGVLVDANDRRRTQLAQPFSLRDLDVAGIKRADPGSSRGRGEACVWLGNPGTAARVRARDCGWTGVWTGTAATGLHVTDVDVDVTRTGVYLEHFTYRSLFERIHVGRGVRVGLSAEWADPGWGGLPASVDNVIEASRFESSLAGVYLDEGTTRTIIRGSTFAGQRWAAIGDYEGVDNAYYGNDYRGIGDGAVTVTRKHINTAPDTDG
jgi:hypothetical protein